MEAEDRTEFLKQQALKKKEYRQRLKLAKQQEPVVEVEPKPKPISNGDAKTSLKSIFSDMETRKEKKLSPITVTNYVMKINTLAKNITGNPYETSKFLYDADKVIKHLKEVHLKNSKDYISPIIRLLRFEGANDSILNTYLQFMVTEKTREDESRGDNLLTKQKDIDNSIPMKEIMEKYNSYDIYDEHKNVIKQKLLYKLIVAFYFDSNVVPRNDLSIMKLAKVGKKDLNAENNYILMKEADPVKIVMMAYKTASTYGKQVFALTTGLHKLLKLYIAITNKVNGDSLFLNADDKEYNTVAFSRLIRTATKEVLGKGLNVDLIRSIIITDFYSSPQSINAKKAFANKFLHSSDTQMEYAKLNI